MMAEKSVSGSANAEPVAMGNNFRCPNPDSSFLENTPASACTFVQPGHCKGGAMMAEKLYTSKQVAEILQVHHRTVLVWLRNGKLHGVKMGRLWRIPESELNRIFEVYNQKKLN